MGLSVILVPFFTTMGVLHNHNSDIVDLYCTCRHRVNLLRIHGRAMGLPVILISFFITIDVLHGHNHDTDDQGTTY